MSDVSKGELIRRLRYGDLIRLFRHRWGYILPDDDAGRDDLWALVCNVSLAQKEPEKKMRHVIELWAPWMRADEREDYVKHVWGLDIYERTPSAKELGERLGVTNAVREQLKLWQFKPIDMTDEQLKEQRRRKNNERRRAKRSRTRSEYLASCLTATKPWEAEGIHRRTWERRRVASRGRDNSSSAESISCDTSIVESPIGLQQGRGRECAEKTN